MSYNLAKEQIWMLNGSSLLCHLNGGDHGLMSLFVADDTENRERYERIQKRDWDISSRDSMNECIISLIQEIRKVETVTPLKRSLLGPHQVQQIKNLVLESGQNQKNRSLEPLLGELDLRYEIHNDQYLAWNFVRLGWLARIGFFLDYLEEEEAWTYLSWAAVETQKHFSSWKELAQTYLVARHYWRGQYFSSVWENF